MMRGLLGILGAHQTKLLQKTDAGGNVLAHFRSERPQMADQRGDVQALVIDSQQQFLVLPYSEPLPGLGRNQDSPVVVHSGAVKRFHTNSLIVARSIILS
jgi:hypothetical protein